MRDGVKFFTTTKGVGGGRGGWSSGREERRRRGARVLAASLGRRNEFYADKTLVAVGLERKFFTIDVLC